MYKIPYLIIIMIVVSNCSIDHKSGIWKDKRNPLSEKNFEDIEFKNEISFSQFKENVVLYGKKSKFPKLMD